MKFRDMYFIELESVYLINRLDYLDDKSYNYDVVQKCLNITKLLKNIQDKGVEARDSLPDDTYSNY